MKSYTELAACARKEAQEILMDIIRLEHLRDYGPGMDAAASSNIGAQYALLQEARNYMRAMQDLAKEEAA